MTKRSVLFALLFSVYCSSLSVAQLYTDEVQVVSGLGGNVGIGTSSPNPNFAVTIVKGSSSVTLGGQSGLGDHVFNIQGQNGRSFGLNAYDAGSGKLITDIGINYALNGGNSITQYTIVGEKKAPFIRLDAEEGSITLFGENGTGGAWRVSTPTLGVKVTSGGNVGIGTTLPSQKLSVNGNASKATGGDWLANSDARLKTNISPLHSQETLAKMLQLQGITYEWSDDKTGLNRPAGIQYGFTAQNIQEVFPSLVVEDDKGYLQSSYSTYDAMLVESIRALNEKIERLERENGELKTQNEGLKTQVVTTDARIEAELQAIKLQLLKLGGQNAVSPANTQE